MTPRHLVRLSLLAGCASVAAQAASATPDDVLVMARNLDAISTFDPAQIDEVVTDEIIRNTCDSLVDIDPADEAAVIPSMAESWTVSDDGLTITFELVQGAVFPSGNPVTAEDAAWSLARVVKLGFGNAATLTEYGFTAEGADDAFVATGPDTLEMHLDKPNPSELILQAVAANRVAAVLDRETIMAEEVDGDLGSQYPTTNTACVGPYALRQWSAGDVVVLEANEGYYGDAPEIPRWIIRHVPEAGAQRLLLEQGDVDVARDLGAEDLRALAETDGVRVEQTRKHQLFYMGFDNGQESFADPRVRWAFKYLFDYDALADTVMAHDGVPRADVVPLGAYGALDEAGRQPYSLDLDPARALLEEAGYGDGFGARLFIGNSSPYAAPIAQNVQANAAEVGIDLQVEQMADAQLFSAFRRRDFDTIMLSWSTSVPHAHGMLSRHAVNPDNSEAAALTMYPTWRASWYDEDLNRRVEEALFERDEAKQLGMYAQLQRDHMESGPFAYLFQIRDTAGVRDEVTAWPWNAFRVCYADVAKG